MPNTFAALVCATGFWVIAVYSAHYQPAKRPAGEAWVVTASDKLASRPALVRAHVPFKVVALSP